MRLQHIDTQWRGLSDRFVGQKGRPLSILSTSIHFNCQNTICTFSNKHWSTCSLQDTTKDSSFSLQSVKQPTQFHCTKDEAYFRDATVKKIYSSFGLFFFLPVTDCEKIWIWISSVQHTVHCWQIFVFFLLL